MVETHTAVVDRIVDGKTAVLLVERADSDANSAEATDGTPVAEITLPAEELPTEGRHGGAVLEIDRDDGEVVAIRHRPAEERTRRDRIREKLDRLSKPLDERDR
ncbi:MAG: DUF3006 domain-containing protein [Natronomonas sp.]